MAGFVFFGARLFLLEVLFRFSWREHRTKGAYVFLELLASFRRPRSWRSVGGQAPLRERDDRALHPTHVDANLVDLVNEVETIFQFLAGVTRRPVPCSG